jgi:shikimate dehydrogenase
MTAPYAEVIGDPIAHSKSPLIHRFWLDALKLPGDYRAVHVRPDELAVYFESRNADPAWRGCNITVPHKQAALAHVPDPGGIRDSIGAINTVFRDEAGAMASTNTDAAGFWSPISALDLAGKPVAVVGAGGAARAVLFALARMGVGQVTILNRTPLKAAGLLATFGQCPAA